MNIESYPFRDAEFGNKAINNVMHGIMDIKHLMAGITSTWFFRGKGTGVRNMVGAIKPKNC